MPGDQVAQAGELPANRACVEVAEAEIGRAVQRGMLGEYARQLVPRREFLAGEVRRPAPPLPPEPSGDEPARVDLHDLPAFTIDPDTAKDFDDAISVRRDGDGLRAWVHIADVSAYVPPGSPLDRDAAERASQRARFEEPT